MNQFATPILLLIFNRPETTGRVFETIRRIRPVRLFIAADGPRSDKPEDAIKCLAARHVSSQVDWPCKVETLYREDNLGCKMGVSSAIDWFFEHVAEGIILEDDCLPADDFFPFCAELLHKFRDHNEIMAITGFNAAGKWKIPESYFFSRFGGVWGWATWKRAWKKNDVFMESWKYKESREIIKKHSGSSKLAKTKEWSYDEVFSGKKNSWAYAWEYAKLVHNGLTISPSVNLIRNIGFGKDATHTCNISSGNDFALAGAGFFPLIHPASIEADSEYDLYLFKKYWLPPDPAWRRLIRKYMNMTTIKIFMATLPKKIKKWIRIPYGLLSGIHYISPNFLYKGKFTSSDTIVDVGCGSKADFSVEMIKRFGLSSCGIDPTKKHATILTLLQRNTGGRFKYFNVAVSSMDGEIQFNESENNESGSILPEHRNVINNKIRKYAARSVSLRNLPDFLGLQKIKYIKLDIEGAEYNLISSLKHEDIESYDQIFVEFHHHATKYTARDTKERVRVMTTLGFRHFTFNNRDYLFYKI